MDRSLAEALTALRPLRAAARELVSRALLPRERGWAGAPRDGAGPAAGASEALRREVDELRRGLGLWGLTAAARPAPEGEAAGAAAWPHTSGAPVSPAAVAAAAARAPWLAFALLQEELHRSPLGVWTHGLFARGEPPAALLATTGEQRARFLDPCADGRRVACQVMAPAGEALRVRPARGGAVLDGALHHVPTPATADLLIVVAPASAAGQRWDAFVCDPDLAGYRVGPAEQTMGSVPFTRVAWEHCHVPEDRIVHDVGVAAARWRALLQATVLAAGAVGAADRCLRDAVEYATRRATFGKPIGERQAIQWMLADSARELHAARLLVYRAAHAADQGGAPERAAAAAKVWATDTACAVIDRALQIHGGSGYTADLPFERYWRDLRYYRLAEGTNDDLSAEHAHLLVDDLDR